MQTVVECEVT